MWVDLVGKRFITTTNTVIDEICVEASQITDKLDESSSLFVSYMFRGGSRGARGPGPPLTTKNEAPAPKFYKTEAPEWQF